MSVSRIFMCMFIGKQLLASNIYCVRTHNEHRLQIMNLILALECTAEFHSLL